MTKTAALDQRAFALQRLLSCVGDGGPHFDQRLQAFAQAHNLRPEMLHDLGVFLAGRGRIQEAIACYRRALEMKPGDALALNNLGLALRATGSLDDALAAHRRAVAVDPLYADGHNGLAAALAEAGQSAVAIEHYQRALAIDRDHVEALVNLGNLLRRQDRLDEAAAVQRRAATLRPCDAEVLNNLAITLQERNDTAEAIDCFRRAAAVQPNHAGAHVNLAMALLSDGRLGPGSAEYEWRWRGYKDARLPAIVAPLWDGRPGPGALLLWAEQGLGDTIQFVRYAPLLRARTGRVILACAPALHRLMRMATGVDAVIGLDEPLPPVDAYLPLLGAMHRLGTTLESIPAAIPYLAAEPERAAAFDHLLAGDGMRVGLVWGGHPKHPNDRRRSLAPALLEPLLDAPGVRFISLQVGPRAADLANPALAGRIVDLAPQLVDLADAAAALSRLDLVITVDTAIAHLAGALGRPCWVLLPFSADWRWLQRREDSPWYPTVRLFRQTSPGDWAEVVRRVRSAITAGEARPTLRASLLHTTLDAGSQSPFRGRRRRVCRRLTEGP